MDIQFAPEIRGVHCPHCGGSLVRHSNRAYCDECELFVKPVREGHHKNWDRNDPRPG